jgi:DNA-binding MurR/RpiR family transcriptional regulator
VFFTKLRVIYPSLTYSEIKIADYILANCDNTAFLTSQELADAINVSQATVIRFSQKLGYKSYRNLLQDLERSDMEDEAVQEIQLRDSISMTNEKVKGHMQRLLDMTCELNSEEAYKEAISLIEKARTIFCYGFLSTGSMADHMRCLLQLFGFNAYCMDNYSILEAMRNYGSDALLIAFSKSGETNVTNEVVAFAKKQGIKIIGITNMAPNTMSTHLDVWLKVVFSQVRTRFLHYTDAVTHLYLIDTLILNLYKRNFVLYSDRVAEHVLLTKHPNMSAMPLKLNELEYLDENQEI